MTKVEAATSTFEMTPQPVSRRWVKASVHLILPSTPIRSRRLTHARKDKGMAKSTRNSGNRWTSQEIKQLKELAHDNTPTRVIGLKLGRSENAVYAKASDEGVSLKPTNQSPYNRRSG